MLSIITARKYAIEHECNPKKCKWARMQHENMQSSSTTARKYAINKNLCNKNRKLLSFDYCKLYNALHTNPYRHGDDNNTS